jgi:hypothetical protein
MIIPGIGYGNALIVTYDTATTYSQLSQWQPWLVELSRIDEQQRRQLVLLGFNATTNPDGFMRRRHPKQSRALSPGDRRRRQLIDRDGTDRCHYCPRVGTTIDHVVPRSRGGTHDIDNTVLSCEPCNRAKGRRTPEEWMTIVDRRRELSDV